MLTIYSNKNNNHNNNNNSNNNNEVQTKINQIQINNFSGNKTE